MERRKRALTGIRATGELHLGHFLAVITPGVKLQESFDCLYFIADLHALTTTKDRTTVRESALDVAASWIALGLDTTHHLLWRQSDLPAVTELAWYLSCVTGLGFLEKAHAFKDAAEKNKETNHGVLAYPVLMAADILLFDSDVVPVGKDQKQHVEMARDMAGYFNTAFEGDFIKLPEARIEEEVMLIPGLDGRKMSKSYNNTIPLFCEEEVLRKKVMSLKTDSTPVDASKVLRGTLLSDLLLHFASTDEFTELEGLLAKGGFGWGHAKERLFEVINRRVAGPRARYREIRSDVALLNRTLEEGASKASSIAEGVLNRVRDAAGFYPRSLRSA